MHDLLATVTSVILLFFIVVPTAYASQADILLVNQVRGNECCDPGSEVALKNQLDTVVSNELPTYFALRFDALEDRQFISQIVAEHQAHPEIIKPALFLEITPSLAQAAGVIYKASETEWYKAQNVYTIGYNSEEKKKLIDTLMEAYQFRFDAYPELTVGWFIDTPTLNYLHQEYGVLIHEITREQWGTDSYTLYGGPAHFPYPASANWAFLPDYSQPDNLLIVRQTLTDPLWNYGDTHALFTSQPNDYSQDGKDFSYFTRLIDQAISQPQRGFALIGLETSMATDFQEIYFEQLDYIKQLQQADKIAIPTAEQLKENWNNQSLTIYQGKDLVKGQEEQVWWITTNTYRLRLRKSENEVYIDDIRVYSKEVKDPYTNYQAKERGYWVAPFILDGSRWNTALNKQGQKQISDGTLPMPDTISSPNKIIIAQNVEDLRVEKTASESGVVKIDGRNALNLSSEHFWVDISGLKKWQYVVVSAENAPEEELSEGTYNLFEKRKSIMNSSLITLDFLDDGKCYFIPEVSDETASELREEFRLAYFPEGLVGEFFIEKSAVYLHNTYAVVGKNPARIVVKPRDRFNLPAALPHKPVVSSVKDDLKMDFEWSVLKNQSMQFYDIFAQKPGRTIITFSIAKENFSFEAYFAPHCPSRVWYCLTHPQEAWWYWQSRQEHTEQLEEKKTFY